MARASRPPGPSGPGKGRGRPARLVWERLYLVRLPGNLRSQSSRAVAVDYLTRNPGVSYQQAIAEGVEARAIRWLDRLGHIRTRPVENEANAARTFSFQRIGKLLRHLAHELDVLGAAVEEKALRHDR